MPVQLQFHQIRPSGVFGDSGGHWTLQETRVERIRTTGWCQTGPGHWTAHKTGGMGDVHLLPVPGVNPWTQI